MKAVKNVVSEEIYSQIIKQHMDIPFNNLLGFEVTEIKPGEVTIKLKATRDLLNGHGIIHGGVTATLCDNAMGMAMLSLGKNPTTVEMKVNYMSPVQLGEELKAVGRVIRSGRTLTIVEADVFIDDKIVIKALGTYIDIK